LALTASAQVVRGAGSVVGRVVDLGVEVATIGVGVAGGGAQASTRAVRSATGVLRRVVAVGA
jgi:hypothetical protein